jgi:hypothetical protein
MKEKFRKIIDKYFWIIFIGFVIAIFFVLFSMIKGAMASFPYDAKTLNFQYTSAGTYNLISDTATKTILYIGVNTQDDTKVDLNCGGETLFRSNKWQSSGFFLQAKCADTINLTTDKANVFITMTYVEYDYAINPPVFAVSADTALNFSETGKETWDIEFNGTTSKLYFSNYWTAGDILLVFSIFCFAIFYIAKTIIGIFVKKYVSIKKINQ